MLGGFIGVYLKRFDYLGCFRVLKCWVLCFLGTTIFYLTLLLFYSPNRIKCVVMIIPLQLVFMCYCVYTDVIIFFYTGWDPSDMAYLRRVWWFGWFICPLYFKLLSVSFTGSSMANPQLIDSSSTHSKKPKIAPTVVL